MRVNFLDLSSYFVSKAPCSKSRIRNSKEGYQQMPFNSEKLVSCSRINKKKAKNLPTASPKIFHKKRGVFRTGIKHQEVVTVGSIQNYILIFVLFKIIYNQHEFLLRAVVPRQR